MTMRRQALGSAEPLVTSLFLFLTLLLLLSIPSLIAKAEPAQQARAMVVNPGDMNTGALLLKSEKEGGLVEAPRLNTDVVIDVNGTVARTVVPVVPLTVNPKSDASPLSLPPATLDMNQRIVIFLLALAFLSAVTLGLWRYHRRDFASPRRIGRRI
jgi:hypothetical protein